MPHSVFSGSDVVMRPLEIKFSRILMDIRVQLPVPA